MLGKNLALITEWVWNDRPREEQPPIRLARQLLQVLYIFLREFKQDQINLRASALTFTVVLSLVPVLALGTAVLKGLGAGDQMRQAAYSLVDRMESPAEQDDSSTGTDAPAPPPSETAAPAAAATHEMPKDTLETAKTGKGLTTHLHNAVDQIFDYVDRTNFATLGAFGIIGLMMAVLSVLGSIELAMNSIWQTDAGRPFGRKLMDYLALIILLPVTVNIALAVQTTIHSPALLNRLQTLLPMLWLQNFLLNILPFIAVIATFTILYQFLPNLKVRFMPALIGGLCGGASWIIIQILYLKLQIGVARYNAIYGSFATLPLLLIWLQMAWVVFLAGAEVAYAVQARPHYTWKSIRFNPMTRLAIAFTIMETVMEDFRYGKVTCMRRLVQETRQPDKHIREILEELLAGGRIRLVTGKDEGYMPAAPAEETRPSDIVDLILGTAMPDLAGSPMAEEAQRAAREALADRKICCTKKTDCNNLSHSTPEPDPLAANNGGA